VAETVRALREAGHRVSIDSLNPAEIEAAVAAGAELVLSVNSSNRDRAVGWGCEVVVVPDVPATLERREVQLTCGRCAADHLDDDVDTGVFEDGERVGGDRNATRIARLLRITHRRPDEADRAPGHRLEPLCAALHGASDGRADRPEPEDPDAEGARHFATGRPQVMKPIASTST
jgi:hypothetical protein